ncbi:MAG: trypsin-like peptidase domain-containing protein [Candidatus Acidiferrales bacterium]
MFCPKCGKELPDDSHFCLACGHAIVSGSSGRNGKNATVVAGVVVLAVAVVAIVTLDFWDKSPNKAATSAVAQSATQTTQSITTPQPAREVVPHVLSPEEIFNAARGGMALILCYDSDGHERGLGSGFVVSPDGTAITNYHVIRGAFQATGKFDDGTMSDVAGVLGYDPNHDVAVIRFSTPPKTILKLGDSDDVQVGQRVVAIGSPLGLQDTLSVGVVSGIRSGVIQMSAPISPGSSGGAVFDSTGYVVGISVATITSGQNLNFAVPINWAKPYVNAASLTSLRDVATTNTVTQAIVDGSFDVAPRAGKSWNVVFNHNTMADAAIDANITSMGGMDGKITLLILYQNRPIYTCRSTACETHQPLAQPGVYQVLLDNRISPAFGRTVNGEISLTYVK